MREKRWLLILVLLAVLGIGWLLCVRTVSGTEEREAQAELVAQAEMFAEKRLYIRAIPLYERALSYDTEQNIDIECRLLELYKEYGDTDSYIELAKERMKLGSAQEQEYLITAEYYFNSYASEEALSVLKEGMVRLQSTVLEEYYEANRYAYKVRVTDYQEIIPTRDNILMPAYDGMYWYYIDKNGKRAIQEGFDRALPFNRYGYAVVSKEGNYYTIIESGERYGIDETGVLDVSALTNWYVLAKEKDGYGYYDYDFCCVSLAHRYDEMTANACGVAAVKKDGKWGIITDAGKTVVDFVLEEVATNSLGTVFENNVAMVKENGLWYLINTEGEKISDQGFYDAKAPESSGYIAVADQNGKWGFINQKAELMIAYQYRDAYSFSNSLASVQKAGTWGYISEKNEWVIDERLEDAKPFHNGVAQAQSSLGMLLIELEYVEE